METDFAILNREAEQIVRDIGIPPCPMILTKLMQEMRADEPDFGKLGRLIGGDASLAAAMLKTVNSPFYGLRTKAGSVTQAIALLGLRHVAELVTGLLLRQAFPVGTSDSMDDFWDASSGIVRTNDLLVRHFKHVRRDGLQTFAVFRDSGMLAMMQKFPSYKPVLPGAKPANEICVTESEEKRHSVSHAHVGYVMAKTWLLPEGVCEAVLRHHDYLELQTTGAGLSEQSLQHIAITLAAEHIFVKHELGATSAEWSRGRAFALDQMGISQAEFDKLAGTVAAELATQAQ